MCPLSSALLLLPIVSLLSPLSFIPSSPLLSPGGSPVPRNWRQSFVGRLPIGAAHASERAGMLVVAIGVVLHHCALARIEIVVVIVILSFCQFLFSDNALSL